MADTHRLALITQSLSKDDRTDAERLAELGLRRPAMLNPIKPCSRETQSDRTGLKAREASSIVLIGISLYCGHLAQSNIVWMPR